MFFDDIEDGNFTSFVVSLISRILEEAVLRIQNQLVMILASIEPSNYDSMKESEHLFLSLLDGIPVNNEAFSGHVKEFIDSATGLSGNRSAINNKIHFDDISKVHEKAVSVFNLQSTLFQALQEEASQVGDTHRHTEDKLCSETQT